MSTNGFVVAATAVVVSMATWAGTAGAAAGVTAHGTAARGVPVTATATRLAPPRITWGRCTDPTLAQFRAQCGVLTVPMDYNDPAGQTIKLAVSRVKHTTPRSQGVMLTNPGGPGASGLMFAALGKFMPLNSGAGYDWIGFDPRGVGASRPALSCSPNYFHGNRPPYVPTSRALVQTWLSRSKSYAQACGKYGALLDHMKTTDTVMDMERLRQALGASRINFYGYSYGTYLGQVYATMYPSRVRRMVLDSNVDPTKVWYPSGLDQAVAFQRAFDVFARWVARYNGTYHLGRTGAAVERLYLKQRRLLRQQPAAGVLGPSEWDDAFLIGGYLQAIWPQLAQGFSAWVHNHNPRPLIRAWRFLDTPGNDNTYAVFNAVTCTDAPSPPWSTVAADSWRLYRVAPIPTWAITWNSTPCLYWPAKSGRPVTVRGNGTSALLVGQTLDAATPFAGSLEVRSRFPNSRLVAIRGGTTHGSTPDLSGPCAAARVAAYLKTGALPPRLPGRRADVSCAAPPQPRPATGGPGVSGRARALALWPAIVQMPIP